MQRVLGISKKQYHAMFGESFAAVAPLAFAIGVGATMMVTYGARALIKHPEVYTSQEKRGQLLHDESQGNAEASYRSHWVRNASAAVPGANMNEYHTNVFTRFNQGALGGPRPRLDMEQIEKL